MTAHRILAIDPGPTESAFVVWDGTVVEFGHVPNEELRMRIMRNNFGGAETCAIEMIASYGMAVGAETFNTCRWIGRFEERAVSRFDIVRLVYRKDVKMHLCQSMRAKDANVRQALIDKHGGTKKGQPLHGISKHCWAALAVADYTADTSEA